MGKKKVVPDSYAAYFPSSEAEESYLAWLEAPGLDLGMYLGDGPSVEQRVAAMKKARRKARGARKSTRRSK